ncbi:MAG: hypothetical protein ABW034_16015 [Steroidobacteraceae bacterium]
MQNSTDELPWFTAPARTFGANDPANESVQTEHPKEPYSIAETYWFSVGNPQGGLVADFYTVMRRNLNVALTAVWIYRGMDREHPMTIEHYNHQTALPSHEVTEKSIKAATFGMSFEIIEPLKRTAVRYRPPNGEVEADLNFDALLPMVTTASADHYDQAMWCTGRLRLRDEVIEVNAPGFRDRSWGVQRPEEPLKHPPLAYIWGVGSDKETAFNLRVGDDPSRGVEWDGVYPVTASQIFHGGWLQRGGELRSIVKASRQTRRDATNLMKPLEVTIRFEDDQGESHLLRGRPVSSMWFFPWGNVFAWFEYMVWDLDGRTAHGEVQDFTWPDYCRRFWK